jgi:hypothetical protein
MLDLIGWCACACACACVVLPAMVCNHWCLLVVVCCFLCKIVVVVVYVCSLGYICRVIFVVVSTIIIIYLPYPYSSFLIFCLSVCLLLLESCTVSNK